MAGKILFDVMDPEFLEWIMPLMPDKVDQNMQTLGFHEHLMGFKTFVDSRTNKEFIEYWKTLVTELGINYWA